MLLAPIIVLAQLVAATNTVPAADVHRWSRHTIDASSEGADGVRAADINGDGLPDIATAWEEGNSIRLYLNPGFDKAREIWPKAVVAAVATPEDAVFADMDGDGAIDMVSCSEGTERQLWFHWAPASKSTMLTEAWETFRLPVADNRCQWMFSVPADVDGDGRIDLIAGAKGADGVIGWFRSPANPRNLADWTWHPLRNAGWIMSLIRCDMNDDGFQDIVYSDRKGPQRGVGWLEHPGKTQDPQALEGWQDHAMGGQDHEVMFLCPETALPEKNTAWWCTTRDGPILRISKDTQSTWNVASTPMPLSTGTGKGISVGDIDGDGIGDVVISCENAADKVGVFWLKGLAGSDSSVGLADDGGSMGSISGLEGTKFDLVYLYDFDGDGDLDVATCEEREGLGVIWYENPGLSAVTGAK